MSTNEKQVIDMAQELAKADLGEPMIVKVISLFDPEVTDEFFKQLRAFERRSHNATNRP